MFCKLAGGFFEDKYMNKDLTEAVSLDVQHAFDYDTHQRILKKRSSHRIGGKDFMWLN